MSNFLGYEKYQPILESIYEGLGIPMSNNLEIFEQGWPGNDTVCGWGSTMEHTKNIRKMLPKIIKDYHIESINDVGCGDLFWIKTVDLTGIQYCGYDIYERSTWSDLKDKGWKLKIANVCTDTLVPVDLTIVRDVFIHLPNRLILDALDKLRFTTRYLLTTNFIRDDVEEKMIDNFSRYDSANLKHAKLDLRHRPFNLGNPELMIPEDYPFKNMSLWRI